MNTSADDYQSVEDYIQNADPNVREILEKIRGTFKKVSPNAVEGIAYAMPAYKLNGKPLVYFAAFPNHIGFYATPDGHAEFEAELSKYKHGKGSVQFPLDAVPYDLIARMTAFKTELLS